jgi:F-type H+-transporting ATPase subunit delta
MAKLISKTYGDALFDLVLEQNKLEATTVEIQVVLQSFRENRDLSKLLNSPRITKEEKINVIDFIFKDRLSDHVVGFLTVIVNNGRSNNIEDICFYYLEKVKEYLKIGVAYITTATELPDSLKEEIKQKLIYTTSYVEIEMNYKIDKSIIGGLIIKIGDRVVDHSIKSELHHLKNVLISQVTI